MGAGQLQYWCSEDAGLLQDGKQHERKGDCWDNTVAESSFGSLKNERVFFSNHRTRDEARQDIGDYIEMFYNSRRRHSYLGYVSPRQFEEMRLLKKPLRKGSIFT